MRNFIFVLLLSLAGGSLLQAQSQSDFYLGVVNERGKISQNSDFFTERTMNSTERFWMILQRATLLYLDEQALATWPEDAAQTPRPGLLLMATANPTYQLPQYAESMEASWFLQAPNAWLDLESDWPMPLAVALGEPLEPQAQQNLTWAQAEQLLAILEDYPGEFKPVTMEPANLADLLTWEEIAKVAPEGKPYVMVLTVASPAEDGSRYEHRPTMLIFF